MSRTTNSYIVCTKSVTTVRRHTLCERLFLCCRIRPEGLLYDAERDLLAIAKFTIIFALPYIYRQISQHTIELCCWSTGHVGRETADSSSYRSVQDVGLSHCHEKPCSHREIVDGCQHICRPTSFQAVN